MKKKHYTVGIDLGSRAVKAVLFDVNKKKVISERIADTTTDMKADSELIFSSLLEDAGIIRSEVECIMATGYGRFMPDFATFKTTEITCHAAGVYALVPDARTVIDMGGQDSKAILMDQNGKVGNFLMNDRCAAGTGRFLEVVAKILCTDVNALAKLALKTRSEIDISSMCVVFAESEIVGLLSRGIKREDLAAGIHRALAKRIAGLIERIRYQPPVVFTGGVAKNPEMARALGRELKEKLIIPPDPRMTGALGAAILAARKIGKKTEKNISVKSQKSRPPSSCCSDKLSANHAGPESVYLHSVPALQRFDRMVSNCIEYASDAKKEGKKIVSIFCEYTPRELILAAGAVPALACGGSHDMAQTAEKELPVNLCPLIKSSYGFAMKRSNPIFEMSDMVVAETTCDGKKKMYELLGEKKKLHILELTQKPDEEAAFNHWFTEVKLLKVKLEKLTGTRITRNKMHDAIKLMNKERNLRKKIAEFAGNGLKGSEVLNAKSIISCLSEDLLAYKNIIRQLNKKKTKVVNKPRILITGVPMPHGAEKILNLIEESGGSVVAQENCTGLKPLMENVSLEGDPLKAIAKKYFHLPCSCMMPNKGRFKLINRLIRNFKPEGVIDLIWVACHTYNVESVLLKKHIEEKFSLPLLKIETDYSPSDSQQIRIRIETFLALISKGAGQ